MIVGLIGLFFFCIFIYLVIGRFLIEFGRVLFESFCFCFIKREVIFEIKYLEEYKRRNVFIILELVMLLWFRNIIR